MLNLLYKMEGPNKMEQESDLMQIRRDFLSYSELDHSQIDVYTRKSLIKGILNNFFDYLENSAKESPCKFDKERLKVKL